MNLREHLRERNCPVCGSADRSTILHPANFNEAHLDEYAFASRKLPELMHLDLVRCPTCTLIYASPAFTPEFLSSAYGGAAYDSNDEAYFAARTYASLIPYIKKSLPTRNSALEVGTGNGAFLIELKKAGFDNVCGVEPSSAAYNTAQPHIRESIRPGMFRAADFTSASIDLLACFQTMEHLEDPHELCASTLQLLKPGGAIYLITHDYDSWVTRLFGRKSPIFDVEHLQLFSKSSLRYLLESCGFERVEIRTIRNRYPLSYWFRLAPIPNSAKQFLIRLLHATRIGRIPLSLNIGNLAVIGYKSYLR